MTFQLLASNHSQRPQARHSSHLQEDDAIDCGVELSGGGLQPPVSWHTAKLRSLMPKSGMLLSSQSDPELDKASERYVQARASWSLGSIGTIARGWGGLRVVVTDPGRAERSNVRTSALASV